MASAQSQDALLAMPDEPKTRVRRRARKGRGPPQLQFVTATDPSEFKGEQAKRSVRSQAMIQYRYQSAEQKQQKKRDTQGQPTRAQTAERVVPIRRADEIHAVADDAFSAQWHDNSHSPVYSQSPEERTNGYGHSTDTDPLWSPYSTAMVPAYSPNYANAMATIPLNEAAKRAVESEDEKDAILLQLLATKLATSCVGSSMDPFSAIPKFATPELNSNQLVRSCNRVFVSKQTLARWVPAMLAHPHILLSSTIMSSTWRDMREGVCGESRRTILLKAEIISWINERLRNADTMFHDDTIMVILHLLIGETWSCNEKTLRIHLSGIARLMTARGILDSAVPFDIVGLTVAIVCTHISIICEASPLPQLYQLQVPEFAVDSSMALPESPLYCPREQMYSVVADPACSAHTYDLLCDVRDLTDLFLAYSADVTAILEEQVEADDSRLRTLAVDYDVKVARFRTKFASMPSAYTAGLPTTNDWIYEVCRLTALIHTSAIITCVPFSVAADPSLNAVVRAAASTPERFQTKRLTEALYEVLERTNIGDLWNNMAGVFYWVCTVGAAAARTSVIINSYSRPTEVNKAYSTWVRRCLTMFSSRTLAHMIFEHPLPLLATQRKLLRVQELIGRNASWSQAFRKHS